MTTTQNNRPDGTQGTGGPTGRVAPIDDPDTGPAASAGEAAETAAAIDEAGGAAPLPAEAGQVSEKEARQVAEAARESAWDRPSFGKELFLGRFRLDLINPWPRSDPDDVARAEEFLGAFGAYLDAEVDGGAIERDASIPDEVFHGMARLGAFGMKIDRKYGGLGLSNLHYCRALMRAGSIRPRHRRAALGAPVDRRAAAAEDVRHPGAEATVPAAARGW